MQFVRYAAEFSDIRCTLGHNGATVSVSIRCRKSEGRVSKKTAVKRARNTLKLKRMGLPERAAERMRTMIIRGELPPGSRTRETQLSKFLGVSRTPLREAMDDCSPVAPALRSRSPRCKVSARNVARHRRRG